MNILHVISAAAAGGAEVYVKDMAKEATTRGHTTSIGFLASAKDMGLDVAYERCFLQELDAAGIKYFFIGNGARRFPWRGALRIRRYVRQNDINIYHSHLTYGVLFGALLSIPRVYTHHNIKMRLGRTAFSLISPLIDQLVGISKICSKALAAHTGRAVTTIFNGVDPKKMRSVATATRKIESAVECIAVGRICPQKNYALLVHAVSLLPERLRSRLAISIIGEGSESDTAVLKSKISDAKLGGTIKLLGKRNDVPQLMADAHLFIMSSAFEGLPIALIEAALSGLPCIVIDVGGCREVIESCHNGIAVAPDDPQSLANVLSDVLSNPTLLSEYSSNALRLSSIFSIGRAVDGHIALYTQALATK